MVDVVAVAIASSESARRDEAQRQMVPSIEDNEHHLLLGDFTAAGVGAALDVPLMVVQGPCELRSMHLLVMADVLSSNTNYWTFGIRRQRSLNVPPSGPLETSVVISAPTTDVTAGKSMGGGIPWSCMWRFWNFDYAALTEDDVLFLRLAPTGTPPALSRMLVSFRTAQL